MKLLKKDPSILTSTALSVDDEKSPNSVSYASSVPRAKFKSAVDKLKSSAASKQHPPKPQLALPLIKERARVFNF